MLKSWISTGKDLSTAVTTLVTDMKELFKNNSSFNTNICSWDVSNVTTMEGMFEGASVFNKDISKWDTNKVTNMDKMFKSCTNFNQDLSKWCVVNLSTEPTDFVTGSSCDSDDKKPVWGTWPECPLIGDWELESWTNNTDNVTQFDQGEKKCDTYPSNALKINGGKEDYGTYKMTTYTCFTDGSTMRTEIEDGVWTYNGTNNQVKVGPNQQNLSVYNLSYTKDANYFTVYYTDYDQDGSSSREITEVWKKKQ
jgi:surface protein